MARDDANSVKEDGPLTASGSVVANDTTAADATVVSAVSGTAAGTVGGNTTGAYGTLTVAANGSYTYALNNSLAAVQALNAGQSLNDTFSYTLRDADGTTSTANLVIRIDGNADGPVVVNGSAIVSEEGLPGGIADTSGTPTDTTNSPTVTGQMTATDIDGSPVTGWTLTAPTTALTSGGVAVTWTGSGSGTLTARAGTLDVATLTIDTAGNYNFTLKAPLDHPVQGVEDVLALNFGATASDGVEVGSGTLTINVEDDMPRAATTIDHTTRLVDTNLMFVLDTSGSMSEASGIGTQNRLQSAVQSIRTLIDKYDQLGEVRVRLVTFSTNAAAQGGQWTTVAAAQSLLTAILTAGPNGGTNYDEALGDAMTAFGSPGKLASGQAVSYFLSDGEPTFGSGTTSELVAAGQSPGTPTPNGTGFNQTGSDTGIQAAEEVNWTSFVAGNAIRSFALGIGTEISAAPLNPIAYNGGTGQNANAIVVTDFAQLDAVLEGTLPEVVRGNLFTAGGTNVGADGLFVKSLTVEGTTYSYTPGAVGAGGTVVVAGGADRGSFDAATQTLTVTTAAGGRFIVDLDGGTYLYERPQTLALTINEVLNYVLSDRDGDTTGSSVNVRVQVNEAPVVTPQSASVSEEGLAGGNPDTVGTPGDTTDAATVSGTMVALDPNGTPIRGWTLEAPTQPVKSQGSTVQWSGSGSGELSGMVGDKQIATLTIDATGNYVFALKAPLDHPVAGVEDVLKLDFTARASDGSASGAATLSINVEDDSPGAAATLTASTGLLDSNLLIVLDTSGSMSDASGIGSQTRLQSAVQSVKTLLDKYDALGDVKVRLVTFSTNASAKGDVWTTVSAAKAQLDAVLAAGPSGGTNYDEALADAISSYSAAGKLGNAQNVAYFLSDGEPTFGSGTTSQLAPAGQSPGTPTPNGTGYNQSGSDTGIQPAEETLWIDFLRGNSIQGYALGMGTAITPAGLRPVAYDGRTGENRDGIVVTAFSQLDAVLEGTIQPPLTGNLFTSLAPSIGGADGVYVRSLTIDGKEYVYTAGATPGSAGSVSGGGSFDAATQQLTVTTALGGKFMVDLDGGNYRYERPPTLASGAAERMDFTLSDRDGDTVGSSLTVNVSNARVTYGTAADETLTGTADVDVIHGKAGNDVLIGLGGADQLFGGDGDDRLEGGEGDDVLHGGQGNDVLLGGAGNDLLYGGPGSDTLTGGMGQDVFAWHLYDGGAAGTSRPVDTITDFDVAPISANGDVLDLRDLLVGEVKGSGADAGNLRNYLDFDTISVPGSTVIHVSTTGGFKGGDYSAGAEDQRIVLADVNLRADLGLQSSSSDNQIIEELFKRGKLVTD